jgi:hypothetical protein
MTGKQNLILITLILYFFSCNRDEKEAPIFDLLESGQTGLAFNNKLTPLPELNMLKYMYFITGPDLVQETSIMTD